MNEKVLTNNYLLIKHALRMLREVQPDQGIPAEQLAKVRAILSVAKVDIDLLLSGTESLPTDGDWP